MKVIIIGVAITTLSLRRKTLGRTRIRYLFLEREMRPLMATVLLGMARLDARSI
jgi:hypothetical protein